MGVEEFILFGKYKFEKEQQYTHFSLTIEAFSANDARKKAEKIAPGVIWLSILEEENE